MNKRSSIRAAAAVTADRPIRNPAVPGRKAGYIAIGLTLLGLSLSGCAATGIEPVAFDQNPGDNGAPSAGA